MPNGICLEVSAGFFEVIAEGIPLRIAKAFQWKFREIKYFRVVKENSVTISARIRKEIFGGPVIG